MVGGNQAKPTTQKPPAISAPTAAASSSIDRRSHRASSNNDGGTSKNNKSTTGEQKIADKKLPRPNPSPKPTPEPHPNPIAPSSRPPFPFPDSSAALGAPPPPTYGFHMLERRTISLADGSVRSYLALPPNYEVFSSQSRPLIDPAARFMAPEFGRFPPFHPEEFRDQRQPMKRKYPGEDEMDRRDERRQRQQFGEEDVRAAKQVRMGSSRHDLRNGIKKV